MMPGAWCLKLGIAPLQMSHLQSQCSQRFKAVLSRVTFFGHLQSGHPGSFELEHECVFWAHREVSVRRHLRKVGGHPTKCSVDHFEWKLGPTGMEVWEPQALPPKVCERRLDESCSLPHLK